MLKTIASLVAGDQERGRQVTGSIAVLHSLRAGPAVLDRFAARGLGRQVLPHR